MIKKFLVFITLVSCVIGYSQENTSSPYSFYGLGEVKFRGTQSSRAMGGLGIQGDSISLNLINPASYSHLKLTTFAIGATTTFTNLKNESVSEKAKRTSLDYLAVGIPMGKFGASFGLMPYTAVGYKIQDVSVNSLGQTSTKQFLGIGNINRVFIGGSYSVNKNLSLGFDFQYNFGSIENQAIESLSILELTSRELSTSTVSGASYNFGALYNYKLNTKYDLYASLLFAPEAKLTSQNERNLATVTFDSNGAEFVNDARDVPVSDTKFIIPTKFAFGFGIGEKNKWLLGTEFTYQNSNKQSNRFDDLSKATFDNSQKYVIGGFYIPQFDSYSSYLKRVVYRAGFRFENTGLLLQEKQINDYGMNFGLGLPLGYSKIDVGLEIGVRGTTYYNLVRENYFNLSVGLSLSDKWFKKRKID